MLSNHSAFITNRSSSIENSSQSLKSTLFVSEHLSTILSVNLFVSKSTRIVRRPWIQRPTALTTTPLYVQTKNAESLRPPLFQNFLGKAFSRFWDMPNYHFFGLTCEVRFTPRGAFFLAVFQNF